MANFNNRSVYLESWYVACPSHKVKRGHAKTLRLLGRSICFYREVSGALHALDAHCPHLGADLGQGKVIGDKIECPFHKWQVGKDGYCKQAPGLAALPIRSVRSYPVLEQWGYVWIWNGSIPRFSLPEVGTEFFIARTPAQTLQCHPHIMIMNGLDVVHLTTLHDIEVRAVELVEKSAFSLVQKFVGEPKSPMLRKVGITQSPIRASFETIGGHLAFVQVEEPVRFSVLFTGQLTEDGGCRSHTIFFLPKRGRALICALGVMYLLLHQDRKILSRIAFRPGFVETDAPLLKFVKIVNAISAY